MQPSDSIATGIKSYVSLGAWNIWCVCVPWLVLPPLLLLNIIFYEDAHGCARFNATYLPFALWNILTDRSPAQVHELGSIRFLMCLLQMWSFFCQTLYTQSHIHNAYRTM